MPAHPPPITVPHWLPYRLPLPAVPTPHAHAFCAPHHITLLAGYPAGNRHAYAHYGILRAALASCFAAPPPHLARLPISPAHHTRPHTTLPAPPHHTATCAHPAALHTHARLRRGTFYRTPHPLRAHAPAHARTHLHLLHTARALPHTLHALRLLRMDLLPHAYTTAADLACPPANILHHLPPRHNAGLVCYSLTCAAARCRPSTTHTFLLSTADRVLVVLPGRRRGRHLPIAAGSPFQHINLPTAFSPSGSNTCSTVTHFPFVLLTAACQLPDTNDARCIRAARACCAADG